MHLISEIDFDTADKDQLEAFALSNFGRNIDKRRKVEDLRADVKMMADGTQTRLEHARAEAAKNVAVLASRKPKTVRNVMSGHLFPWSELYRGNVELEIVEWED